MTLIWPKFILNEILEKKIQIFSNIFKANNNILLNIGKTNVINAKGNIITLISGTAIIFTTGLKTFTEKKLFRTIGNDTKKDTMETKNILIK